MRRVAISLPDAQAEALERVRRRQRIPRSRVIQQALDLYLREMAKQPAIRAYVEGYQRHPEGREAGAFVRAASRALPREDWK